LFINSVPYLFPGIYYLRRNIPATYRKELSSTNDKMCAEYFNGLLAKERKISQEMYGQHNNSAAFTVLLPLDFLFVNANF
jgi:hypothetical protein